MDTVCRIIQHERERERERERVEVVVFNINCTPTKINVVLFHGHRTGMSITPPPPFNYFFKKKVYSHIFLMQTVSKLLKPLSILEGLIGPGLLLVPVWDPLGNLSVLKSLGSV